MVVGSRYRTYVYTIDIAGRHEYIHVGRVYGVLQNSQSCPVLIAPV